MNQVQPLKWKQTPEQIEYSKQAQASINRIVAKAEAEKQAKANGLWDYRSNKIVEA